jgi:hypothetical protein
MPRVLLHTRKPGASWEEAYRDFDRIPATGEYVASGDRDPEGYWYQVSIVLHTPAADDCTAQVFAEGVHFRDVHARAEAAMLAVQEAGLYGRHARRRPAHPSSAWS